MILQVACAPAKERVAEIQLSGGRAHVFEHARDVPMEFWARGFSDTPKDFQYYELIEQTMDSAFEYRYLAVFDQTNRPVALQPLVLTTQDLAVSASEAIVRFVAKLRTIWPHLWQSRMALAGCLVGEGETGAIEPVEVAIPLEEITPVVPQQGMAWALGITRIIPAVGLESWTHPAAAAPRPENFGLLRFDPPGAVR